MLSLARWVRVSRGVAVIRTARASDLSNAPTLAEVKNAIMELGRTYDFTNPFVAPKIRFPSEVLESGNYELWINLNDPVFKHCLIMIEMATDKDATGNSAVNVRRGEAASTNISEKGGKNTTVTSDDSRLSLHHALARLEASMMQAENIWDRDKFERSYRLRWMPSSTASP